jgi:hypothetical protein
MPYKDFMESEDLADDDARITYDTFWKKTDFSIKQKKGKSTMHSSAYRLLAPEAKKDKDLLTLKLKGETKLQVMMQSGKVFHATPLMSVTLDDGAAYISAAAVGIAALALF